MLIPSDEIRTKGYTLLGALLFAREEGGEEGRAAVLEALPDSDRAVFRQTIIASGWYPFRLQVGLYQAIDQVLGRGDLALCRAIGRFTAQSEASSVHKLIFKMLSPDRTIQIAGMMWGRYYSAGRLRVESFTKEKGIALVDQFNPIHRAFCIDLSGWMERTLELTGLPTVCVEHPECLLDGDPVCRFQATWPNA